MMHKAVVIYVAGPYSSGGTMLNIRRAIDAADRLLSSGACPIMPHMMGFLVHYHSYETWMDYCLTLVTRCDAVLRLSGESPGADREVALAQELGIPVLYTVTDAIEWALLS